MKYVEFAGLPGAGKTTLVKELLKRNKDYHSLEEIYENSIKIAFNEHKDSFSCKRYFPAKLSFSLYNLGIFPDSYLPIMSELINLKGKMTFKYEKKYPNSFQTFDKYVREYTDDKNRILTVLNWLQILSEKYIAIETYDTLQEGLILVDEGFLQRTFSIFTPPFPTKEISEKEVKEYLGKIFLPDTLVLTDASSEICEQRMLKRKEGYPGKYKSLDKKQMLNRIDEMKKVSRIIKETFESQGVEVIELSTGRKVEESIKEISRRI